MGAIVNEIARLAALWAAWARVAAGSGMPGADGVSVTGFAHRLGPRLTALSEQLRSGAYRVQPLRLVTGSRGGRLRERGVPTVADRVVQRAFLRVCEPRFVSRTDVTSFAYQRGRSWVDALRQARAYGDSGLRWVFRTDIADFFASVDHRLLMDRVAGELTDPDVVALVRDWVRAPVLTDTGLRDRRAGIPEGAPVSPALANLYLRDVDLRVDSRYGRLVRFADDLALFCADLDLAVAGAEHLLTELAELGLAPNQDKTYLSSFDAGFRMLGWMFHRDGGWPESDNPRWTHPLTSGVSW